MTRNNICGSSGREKLIVETEISVVTIIHSAFIILTEV